MVPVPTRRSLLHATGVGLAGGLAGCSLQRITTTSAASGRTYAFEVENEIEASALEAYPPIDGTPPAVVTLIVEANRPDGAEETIFEQEFDLPPASSRRFEDAFETRADGTSYIVTTKLGEFQRYEAFGHDAEFHSAGHRFTPGGYGQPSGSTLEVTVTETEPKGQYFKPHIQLHVPGEGGSESTQ